MSRKPTEIVIRVHVNAISLSSFPVKREMILFTEKWFGLPLHQPLSKNLYFFFFFKKFAYVISKLQIRFRTSDLTLSLIKCLPVTYPCFQWHADSKIKALPTNAFFRYRQSNVRRLLLAFGYLRTLFRIQRLSNMVRKYETTRSAVVESWEEPPV